MVMDKSKATAQDTRNGFTDYLIYQQGKRMELEASAQVFSLVLLQAVFDQHTQASRPEAHTTAHTRTHPYTQVTFLVSLVPPPRTHTDF